MKIVVISGSPRQGSITCRVAFYLYTQLKEKHDAYLLDVRENPLPPIQSVFTTESNTPEQFRPLRQRMMTADAFILVSPEYNGGFSPAMKNLLDHFPKTSYSRKAMGIVTASDGAFGGMRASMHMQQLICALFGIPCPQMLIVPQVDKKFDEEGNLLDEGFRRNIQNFMTEYCWLADTLSKVRKQSSSEGW